MASDARKPDPTPLALPLSIFIIACDEADRLPRTLEAVQGLADEIVLVDSGSRDGTREVAASFGARIVENAWPGYGPQKRFAEEQCRNAWLLNLDADEIVSPALRAEIEAVFAAGEPKADAYSIPITEVFPGEDAPHPLAYTLSPVRLYRSDKGRYSASIVHDRVVLADGARVAALKGRIHHVSVRSLGDQLAKLNAYSDAQAQDLMDRGETPSLIRLFLEFPAAFLKAYFGRRHFVRGVYGFMTAMNFAFYRYLRIAKHVERARLARRAGEGASPRARSPK